MQTCLLIYYLAWLLRLSSNTNKFYSYDLVTSVFELLFLFLKEAELECDVEKETTSFYEFSKKLKEFLKLLKGSYGAQKR